MGNRAMIAMSGGVDSSVAAFLIKEQGFDATGITLKLFDNEDIGMSREKTCCSLEDIEDARSVASRLGMPYYVLNFMDQFRHEVIQRFIDSYMSGQTPNPCIDCNRFIKFDQLLSRAVQLEFDKIVTGHYAGIEYDKASGRYLLKKAVDKTKDQSYVLYSLTQQQLSMTLFPLGSLKKSEVRNIAKANGFVNAHKHDSQDICFVRDKDYASFIKQYTGTSFEPGDFVDKDDNILGTHYGIIRYTIGQRKGLGITSADPLYVCKILPHENKIVLGAEQDLYSKSFRANQINLISCDRIDSPIKVKAKIRYGQQEQPAKVEQLDDDTLSIEFDTPQRAITNGQSVVLYDGPYVIGGGIISS